jgi:hypothetical protein
MIFNYRNLYQDLYEMPSSVELVHHRSTPSEDKLSNAELEAELSEIFSNEDK